MPQNLSNLLLTDFKGYTGSQGGTGSAGFTGSVGFTGSQGALTGTIANLLITDTTNSSNIYSGAFIVTGGASVRSNLFVGGNIVQANTGSYISSSISTYKVATGTTQGTALTANAQHFHFSSVPPSTGTILPLVTPGTRIFIANDGSNSLTVYPPSGGAIDKAAIDTPFIMAAGGMWEGVAILANTWTSISPDTQGTTNQIVVTQGIGNVAISMQSSATLPGTPLIEIEPASTSGTTEISSTNWVRSNGGFQNQYVYTSGSANGVSFTTITGGIPVNKVKVTIVGGGGAGGGTNATAGTAGSGGGAGATAIYYFSGLTGASTFDYIVGAGGTGASNANGGTGGTSLFTVGSITIVARGGRGGLVGTATSTKYGGGGGNIAVQAGGTAANFLGIPGGGGYPAFTGTTVPTAQAGGGGSSFFGGAAQGVVGVATTPGPSGNVGGGGGGSIGNTANSTGGAGGSGLVIIEF